MRTKPFIIPKQQVMQAYRLVKANAGAAGVDRQSLEDFERNLKDSLYLTATGLRSRHWMRWLLPDRDVGNTTGCLSSTSKDYSTTYLTTC